MKFKLSFVLFFICFNLFASLTCKGLKHLDNPELHSIEKFWVEYAELNSKGLLNDDVLEKLVQKHLPAKANQPPAVHVSKAPVPAANSSLKLDVSKKAKKEISMLPSKKLRENYEEFMNIMSDSSKGFKSLRENPGRWNLEKINAYKGEPVYTIRLNGDYRVLFRFENNELSIMQVNVNDIHKI